MALAAACALAFSGITSDKLWDDEANTAIFARNLLETGALTAWDGENIIGFRDGAELDENLNNVFMPPLQYWLAAGGIALFGDDEFGLRACPSPKLDPATEQRERDRTRSRRHGGRSPCSTDR